MPWRRIIHWVDGGRGLTTLCSFDEHHCAEGVCSHEALIPVHYGAEEGVGCDQAMTRGRSMGPLKVEQCEEGAHSRVYHVLVPNQQHKKKKH